MAFSTHNCRNLSTRPSSVSGRVSVMQNSPVAVKAFPHHGAVRQSPDEGGALVARKRIS
ncbi:MAG: hypothetical protein IJD04_05855 [Desulfovibrionaceae bacterium]|nr:hypothetical protein [Desulfovibrionaceae bacterium]